MASNGDLDNVNDNDSSSDFDLNDSDSDHSFDSDTDNDDQLTESSIGTLDSQATNVDEEFWGDELHDVDVADFEEPEGPRHRLDEDSPVLSYFLLVFPLMVIQHLVDQTNLYAQQCGAELWNPVTLDEMRAFIGLQIIMGINQLPRYPMHWSGNKFIGNKGIQDTMPLKRFQALTRYFHVNDNTTQGQQNTPEYDRLHKIRPLFDMTRNSFLQLMAPFKEQTIDEGIIKYKGRFYAKMYLPDKPVKRGLKIFMRCDKEGYCYDYRPYLGKHDSFRGKNLGERVVKHLCRPLKYKAFHVFFDRFFTSVPLVRTLLDYGIYSCGAIKCDREGFPPELCRPVLARRETEQRQHENLVATAWNDSNYVHILSTNSNPVGDGPVSRRSKGGICQEFLRPPPVESYQKFMAGVDRANQHRSKNPVGHSSKKYWKFFVNFIIELCLTNAFLIFCRTPGNDASKYDLLDFRLEVATQLIHNFSCRKRKLPVPEVTDLTHQLIRLDRSKSTCKLCPKFGEKKRKETVKGCGICNVHLCSLACFNRYHDEEN